MAKKPDQMMDIDIALIDFDPNQPRKTITEKDIEKRARSIEKNDLKRRIKVRPNGDRFILISGEIRLRAMKHLGWEKAPSIVSDVTMSRVDIIMDQLVEDGAKKDLLASERAESFQAVMTEKGWGARQLHESLPTYSIDLIKKTVRLLKLPKNILHLIDESKIPLTMAYRIAQFPTEKEMERYASEVIEKNLTAHELGAALRKSLGKIKRTRSNSTRLERWSAPAGRGKKLFLTSTKELSAIEVIGFAFDGILNLIDQELEEVDFEDTTLSFKTITDLIEAFSNGGVELGLELDRSVSRATAILAPVLMSVFNCPDKTVREQAVRAFNELPTDSKLNLDSLRKLYQGKEQDL